MWSHWGLPAPPQERRPAPRGALRGLVPAGRQVLLPPKTLGPTVPGAHPFPGSWLCGEQECARLCRAPWRLALLGPLPPLSGIPHSPVRPPPPTPRSRKRRPGPSKTAQEPAPLGPDAPTTAPFAGPAPSISTPDPFPCAGLPALSLAPAPHSSVQAPFGLRGISAHTPGGAGPPSPPTPGLQGDPSAVHRRHPGLHCQRLPQPARVRALDCPQRPLSGRPSLPRREQVPTDSGETSLARELRPPTCPTSDVVGRVGLEGEGNAVRSHRGPAAGGRPVGRRGAWPPDPWRFPAPRRLAGCGNAPWPSAKLGPCKLKPAAGPSLGPLRHAGPLPRPPASLHLFISPTAGSLAAFVLPACLWCGRARHLKGPGPPARAQRLPGMTKAETGLHRTDPIKSAPCPGLGWLRSLSSCPLPPPQGAWPRRLHRKPRPGEFGSGRHSKEGTRPLL